MLHGTSSYSSDSSSGIRRCWIENVMHNHDGGVHEAIHSETAKVGPNDRRRIPGTRAYSPRSCRAGHLVWHVGALRHCIAPRVHLLGRLRVRTADRQLRSCPRFPTGGSLSSSKPRYRQPSCCEAACRYKQARVKAIRLRFPGDREQIEKVRHGATIAQCAGRAQRKNCFFRRTAATTQNHAAKMITRACLQHHLVG